MSNSLPVPTQPNAVLPGDLNADLMKRVEQTLAQLDDCTDVDYLTDIHNQARGFTECLRKNKEQARTMMSAQVRIARRIGEVLSRTVRPGNPQLSKGTTIGALPPGVSRDESSKWQRLAGMPVEFFEGYVASAQKPTVNGALKHTPQGQEDDNDGAAMYSCSDWKNLSQHQRETVLREPMGGKCKFNPQMSEAIDWAKWSWNPVTGCLHNCPYCYARDIAKRFYSQGFAPTFIPERLAAPGRMKVPAKAAEDVSHRNVFTCSMADLFGKWVPSEWIQAVLDQVSAHPEWNFLFLTKFPRRYLEFSFPRNAWVGTTVDHQARVAPAEKAMADVDAETKWLSVEPQLTPLHFEHLEIFQWIVMGGASKSTETPEYRVPFEYWAPLQFEAIEKGIAVYHKTNLYGRTIQYPWADPESSTVPEMANYLKAKDTETIERGEELLDAEEVDDDSDE
jgi:protein gp37